MNGKNVFEGLPRGVGQDARHDRTPDAAFRLPDKITSDPDLSYDPDDPGAKVFLGEVNGQLVGIEDDRHMITVAGSRAGKGVSAIVPNLLAYAGSVLAIDPKGELACITAEYRAKLLGQVVHVLDPFGRLENVPWARQYRHSYNPMTILKGPDGALTETAVEDAGLIADALVVPGGGDSHWDDAARNLIEGVILLVAAHEDKDHANLVTVREMLMEGTEEGQGETGMKRLEHLMKETAKALQKENPDAADAIGFCAADFFGCA